MDEVPVFWNSSVLKIDHSLFIANFTVYIGAQDKVKSIMDSEENSFPLLLFQVLLFE